MAIYSIMENIICCQNSPSKKLKYSRIHDTITFKMIIMTYGGATMAVSYKKLFHLLIERDMTTSQLQKKAGFSANIIARLKRNGAVSLDTIESICRTMNCGVDDILEFVPDEEGKI